MISTESIRITMTKLRSMKDGEKRSIELVDQNSFETLKYIRTNGLDTKAGFELGFSDDWKRIVKRNNGKA